MTQSMLRRTWHDCENSFEQKAIKIVVDEEMGLTGSLSFASAWEVLLSKVSYGHRWLSLHKFG